MGDDCLETKGYKKCKCVQAAYLFTNSNKTSKVDMGLWPFQGTICAVKT
jgi:hypothetical protein